MLQPHLEGVEGAEQDGGEQRLAGFPRGEDGERDADPAAPGDHLEEEGVEGRHGEEGAADRHDRRTGDDRAGAQPQHVQALRLDGGRVFTDGTHGEPQRRLRQKPGEHADQHEGKQRQCRLLEQHRPEERNGGEDGDIERLERDDTRRRIDVRQDDAVGEIGGTRRQHGDAETADMLRQAERDGEEGEKQPEQRAHEGGDQHPGPQIRPGIDGEPAGHGADRHDAFDAEVEHAGFFAEQRAQHAEDQRRGDPHRRRPERHRQQDIEDRRHQEALPRAGDDQRI